MKYQKIDRYASYKILIIDDAEDFLGHPADNGAELTGYFKGDTLIKVAEQIGLSNSVIENRYYLENDKLFFVYSVDSSYKFIDTTLIKKN